MEVTVANAYPKRRNCRQNAPLNTPKHAANTMVAKPLQFDDRGQKFEQPQVRKRQASDTSIARPEEHVLVRPQHIQQGCGSRILQGGPFSFGLGMREFGFKSGWLHGGAEGWIYG